MENLTAFIVSTTEYRQWGWNVGTVAFIVTVIMTFGLQLPGLIDQGLKIRRNKSAEGVEPLTAISLATYFLVLWMYSVATGTAAGAINAGVLFFPACFIAASVLGLNLVRLIDFLAIVSALGFVVLTDLWVHKELSYMIVSGAVFVGLVLQPLEMIRTKTSKNLAVSFPATFAIVCVVWTVLGFAIGDWFIGGAAFAFGIVYIWTIALWFRYRK